VVSLAQSLFGPFASLWVNIPTLPAAITEIVQFMTAYRNAPIDGLRYIWEGITGINTVQTAPLTVESLMSEVRQSNPTLSKSKIDQALQRDVEVLANVMNNMYVWSRVGLLDGYRDLLIRIASLGRLTKGVMRVTLISNLFNAFYEMLTMAYELDTTSPVAAQLMYEKAFAVARTILDIDNTTQNRSAIFDRLSISVTDANREDIQGFVATFHG
jgi:hypothetical protein